MKPQKQISHRKAVQVLDSIFEMQGLEQETPKPAPEPARYAPPSPEKVLRAGILGKLEDQTIPSSRLVKAYLALRGQ